MEKTEVIASPSALAQDQRAAPARHADKACVPQTVGVKRQSVGGDSERGCHLAGCHSLRTGNIALALLGNTLATGAITMFGSIRP